MQQHSKPTFTIVGGGIAGLTAAIALSKAGFESILFEAAPQIKEVGAGLGLGANAIKAFASLGIEADVIERGRILPAFAIYDEKGKPISGLDSRAMNEKYGASNFTIHRAALQAVLLSKVEPGIIQLNKRLINYEQRDNMHVLQFSDGTSYETQHLIVADGIHSVVRKKLLPDSEIRYAGYTCWRGVLHQDTLQINTTSETWGAHGRFGIVPLAHKIYWFVCLNAPAHSPLMKAFTVKDLAERFQHYHSPIPEILKASKNEDLIWNDIEDLKPIRQFAFGTAVLIGDAAHATTPNIGQGACMAIEDGVILANELKKTDQVAQAFKSFEVKRMKRVHQVVDTSWRIGRMAQMENQAAVGLRNVFMRALPKRLQEKQLEFLYEIEF